VLDLKKPFKLVNQVRVDETPMHDAVREALVNCLVNTDFYQPWSVIIEKYPDKITLANPDIFQAWKDAGLNAPIVEEMFGGGTPDRTILPLPLDSNNLPIRQSVDSADLKMARKYICREKIV